MLFLKLVQERRTCAQSSCPSSQSWHGASSLFVRLPAVTDLGFSLFSCRPHLCCGLSAGPGCGQRGGGAAVQRAHHVPGRVRQRAARAGPRLPGAAHAHHHRGRAAHLPGERPLQLHHHLQRFRPVHSDGNVQAGPHWDNIAHPVRDSRSAVPILVKTWLTGGNLSSRHLGLGLHTTRSCPHVGPVSSWRSTC
jgi:hypothetical protein